MNRKFLLDLKSRLTSNPAADGQCIRQGSYNSAKGPRATSNFSISGTYDLDSDSSMQVIGKDLEGRGFRFTTPIYVDDTEYPTQMIVIDKKGERGVYIWKRKE